VGAAPTHGYSCANQGISRGWADSYTRGLPCQWIDITDLSPGAYSLRVVVNPLNKIAESDTTNNELTFGVSF
jgi:lysyl oxidase-like protein 2/3/4